MKFPNKINEYKMTAIFYMAVVMPYLVTPLFPREICQKAKNKIEADEVYEALICLFALGIIKMDNEGRIQKC